MNILFLPFSKKQNTEIFSLSLKGRCNNFSMLYLYIGKFIVIYNNTVYLLVSGKLYGTLLPV